MIVLAASVQAAGWKAGAARVDITPTGPIYLSGYANRTHPSEGVLAPLYAKALALEDPKGTRAVIVTTDLIGLPAAISDVVAARVQKQYGLERSSLLLNSSHTHTGPAVGMNLPVMFDFKPDEERAVRDYAHKLGEDLVTVIGGALRGLAPATLEHGTGEAGFAMNRRQATPKGVVIGVNPQGPTDHGVPVLRVADRQGKLIAVLFAYACHNTTLTGEFYRLSGDYAGYAQAGIEEAHPGATALFMMLCGGDQNPNPRSNLEFAEQHGRELAAAVEKVMAGRMEPVRAPLRTAFRMVDVALAPHTRETFETLQGDRSVFKQRLARLMLARYDEGHPPRSVAYPVEAWHFGKDLTLLALGGEVVIDYNLRARREYRKQKLIVAGYSNDVMCYIPSLRVLKEGGYEAVDSMVYYGQPGPFSEDVEETIFEAIHAVMRQAGVK